jgi:ParB/RepB/Spo0J family partition protein
MAKSNVPSGDFNLVFDQGGMKAAMTQSGAKSRDLLMVPIDQLKIVAGLNVRIQDAAYEAHVEEIKESIIKNGFYQHFPISGYAGKEGDQTFIYITGGFTRYEAAKRAIAAGEGIETLPVVLKPPGTSMLDLTIALAQDNTGAPLKPYERAIVIKRLVGYGMDEPVIATRMGISEQYVKDLLYMLSLPMPIQHMVIEGSTTAGTAIQTARKNGAQAAVKILQDALVSAREAQKTDEPAEGTAENEEAPTAAPRVTAGRAARAASGESKIVPKKQLFLAIDYALSLPHGLDWLMRWRKGEEDAMAELSSFKRPRGRRKAAPKAKPEKSGNGRRRRKRIPASDDPFSIETVEE